MTSRYIAWFRPSHGAEIHVGVEDPFEVDWSQRDTFPGHVRCHTFDGHGNRVELLATP